MLSAKQQRCKVPRGPRREKRAADLKVRTVMIDSATSEFADDVRTPESEGKNPAAVALGRMGGKARAEGLSAQRRKQIARKAARSRWKS
jgi:hypothetical protein